jgi:hypothetical protein
MIYPNKLHHLKRLDRSLQAICYAALSISLIFLLLCITNSFRHRQFRKMPADLLQAIGLAQSNIDKEPPAGAKSESCKDLARWSSQTLSDQPYQTGIWCPPPRVYRLRSAPELYPPQSLLASSGYGAFSIISGGEQNRPQNPRRNIAPIRNGKLAGYRWVMVTGIIENRKQFEAFEAAFTRTQYRNPGLDSPDYQSFQVERAEVSDNGDDAKLRWEPRPIRPMYDMKNHWSRTSDDLVDAKYFPPPRGGIGFVFPLGPLVNDSWRENVGHPRIALYETQLRNKTVVPPVHAAVDEENHFGSAANAAHSPQQRLVNSASAINGEMRGASEKPEILFVRYVDYDVQPEKKYRYRLQLVLQNPNWNVPAKYLQESSIRESRYLKTDWSAPTPVVSVPPETKFELLSVDARRGHALVKLIHFDLRTGENQTREFKVERGDIMNYFNQEYYPLVDSTTANESDVSLFNQPVRRTAECRRVDYVTDTVVIDFQPGKRLPGPRRQSGPANILVRDREGNLSVLEERKPQNDAQPKIRANQIVAAPQTNPRDR